jgi:hypothetical protein
VPSPIRSFDDLRVDVLQALKRAIIRKGFLPVADNPPKSSVKEKHVAKKSGEEESPITNDKLTPEAPAEVKEESSSAKEAEKEAEEGPEKLIELTERTQDILFEADTVFPFTLFPDTVTLDREKLTFTERFFWRVARITSVPVSEILSCQANLGPFFGSINLVFSFFADNQRTIKFLWRDDAKELQRMLHGYIIAHKREINTTNVSVEDLKVMLKELGQGASD